MTVKFRATALFLFLCHLLGRELLISNSVRYKRFRSFSFRQCYDRPAKSITSQINNRFIALSLDVKLGRYHLTSLANAILNAATCLSTINLDSRISLADLLLLRAGDVHPNPGPKRKRLSFSRIRDNPVNQRRRLRYQNSINPQIIDQNNLNEDLIGSAFQINDDGSITEPDPHCLGSLMDGVMCQFCQAYRWPNENPNICCNSGKISLPLPKDPPVIFKRLFDINEFVKNIRHYNNAFALASIACSEISMPGFSPCIKIHGKVYHKLGSLIPSFGNSPKYAQTFFYDNEQEKRNRISANPSLRTDIMETLQGCLHEVNPHIQLVKKAYDYCDHIDDDFKVIFTGDEYQNESVNEHRMHCVPRSGEIAAVVPEQRGESMQIVLEKNGRIQNIDQFHKLYDPLHYVLMLPYGDTGFYPELRKTCKGLSIQQFYRFYLHTRDVTKHFNLMMRASRLLQQYACDQFVKIESFRLKWHYSNQKSLRAEKYNGLMDSISAHDSVIPGTRIILPPSHHGSPRWYNEAFQEAMALVTKLGKPDFFVTITCNPRWPDIITSLLKGQTVNDRPDIIARVFYLKLKEVIRTLVEDKVLGRVKAFVAMKEDQKRGLPHCHLLTIMHDEDKIYTQEQLDSFISAEIPNPERQPKLFNAVTQYNIHGPCGDLNRDCPCMELGADGKLSCSDSYPKKCNNEETRFHPRSYPNYLRRDILHGGNSVNMFVRGKEVVADNTMVVPYNPFLSLKFDCHINVEAVDNSGTVKYLFKYVTKGNNRAVFAIVPDNACIDEIQIFENGRFVSSSEAFWRLFEFPIRQMKPSVFKLALHLENEQTVLFDPDEMDEVQEIDAPRTHLTEFFALVERDPEAANICYSDVCQYYTWNTARKIWKRRQRNVCFSPQIDDRLSDTISRIPVISLNPKQSELYFLRLLLHHRKGPSSFTDIRTVDGEVMPTYQQACIRLGIFASNEELNWAMNEAASVRFGKSLRDLFAAILAFCQPVEAISFWGDHHKILCEDIRRKRKGNAVNDEDQSIALNYINEKLASYGLDLYKDFNIDVPPMPDSVDVRSEQLEYDLAYLSEIHKENIQRLTDEQLLVFDKIKNSVEQSLGGCYALDAPGGTGKTFLLTTILAYLRCQKKTVLAAATSGLAATLLPTGRTLHSALKVPLNTKENAYCNVRPRDDLAKFIKKIDLLLIDEFSMGHRYIYEAIERTFRDIRGSDKVFGGVTVLLSGDWRQILPVIRRGGRADTVAACLKYSELWKNFETLKLTINLRLQGGNEDERKEFQKYLLSIGESINSTKDSFIPIPIKHLLVNNTIEGLCDFVFEGIQEHYRDAMWLCKRSILCPRNDQALGVNKLINQRFPGENQKRLSADQALEDSSAYQFPVEFLNTLNEGMPPHELDLKIGCPVMLIRNLDPQEGHCNGTRYIVNQIHQHLLDVTVACGLNVGAKKFIPRIPFIPDESSLSIRMKRIQFPIKPAFAMSINKAQGQSLDRVGVYLKSNVFSHGQLYVALSRCTDPNNLKIYHEHKDAECPKMKNVVYKEVLS